jgi:hypothetical protein
MDRVNANNGTNNHPPDNNDDAGVRPGDNLDNPRPLQRRRTQSPPTVVPPEDIYRQVTGFLAQPAAGSQIPTVENVFHAGLLVARYFRCSQARFHGIVAKIQVNTRPALNALLVYNYVSRGNLQELYINNIHLTPEEILGITTTFTNLTQLSFINCNIGDERATILAQNLPQTLTDLILSTNDIGSDGAGEITLNFPQNLQNLDMSNNQVGNIGAILILSSLRNSTQVLNLSNNSIEDDLQSDDDSGFQFLAGAIPPTLAHLNLSDNYIENEGLIRFVEAIRNRHDDPNRTNISLQSLDLSNNELDDSNQITESLRYLREDLYINVTL